MAPGVRPDDHVIVLFGATGDLARRKLLPGLFHLSVSGLLPERYRIIGSAPASLSLSDDEFRQKAHDAVAEFGNTPPTGETWDHFAGALSFGAADPSDCSPLLAALARAESEIGGSPRRLYHLAVPPVAFTSVISMLGAAGLAPGSRIIVEKPFGTDLASARALNQAIHAVFEESQIFRIDHFLGKESVDNILAFRFGNGIFEPIWNREHVGYVQIDVPETLSIEGRAAFYEETGAFRDMVVTHLLQVLGFVAMEPPSSVNAKSLREERLKVFEAMPPLEVEHVVRGQYEGYRSEPGVRPDSDTETFVALRARVDNWRWHGVPFYLRTGKCMGESRQVVTLGFHQPPLRMFAVHTTDAGGHRGNELVIDFQDPGSITTEFLAKEPGPHMRLGEAKMEFRYESSFASAYQLEGYERLIHDAMIGDQSLFTGSDAIERLWEISTPLLEHPLPVEPYQKGSWGPDSIRHLVAPHPWHLPERTGDRRPPGGPDPAARG
ncbi:MAG TPA: glucose-6-phosphate dehydrogenase [Acidimicrobiales bacterium]|nr:glucose-6-phosphate dehydrogenase [Acidimicrobiales bacterium]